jgi:hypothetical protein
MADDNSTEGNKGSTEEKTGNALNEVKTGNLPWAMVALPTTSAGQSGVGIGTSHSLQPQTWVYGMFLDGDNCQQPLVMGVLAGGPGSQSGRGNDNDGSSGSGSGGDNTPSSGGGGSSGSSGGDSTGPAGSASTPNIPKGSNALAAACYLRKKGYTPEQAAGIVGIMGGESGQTLRTSAQGPIIKSSGTRAAGIAQWAHSRRRAMERMCPNWQTNLYCQLDYLVHELNSTHGRIGRNIKNSRTVADAACAFAEFEAWQGWDKNVEAFKRGVAPTRSKGGDIHNIGRDVSFGNAVLLQMKNGGCGKFGDSSSPRPVENTPRTPSSATTPSSTPSSTTPGSSSGGSSGPLTVNVNPSGVE